MSVRLSKIVLISFLLVIFNSNVAISQTYQIENMSVKTTGFAANGAWVLESNGYVADSIQFSAESYYKFVIKAKAKKAKNGWPNLRLIIDEHESGPLIVDKSNYVQYILYGYTTAGKHFLSINYDNDVGDRKVTLDWISISSVDIHDEEWLVMLADETLTRFPAPELYSISDWQMEELMWGVAKAYEITRDPRYLNYVKAHISNHIDENGNIDIGVSDTIPSILIIWLYQQTGEARYKIAAEQVGQFLVNNYPRTSDGAFIHLPHLTGQLWDDSLGGLGRLLGSLAVITGDTSYFDEGISQFQLHAAHLQDDQTGLFYHGYDETRKARWSNPITGNSSEFWARGNGWIVRGLADFLEYLPQNYPGRQSLITILQNLVNGLIRYQDGISGLWHTVINKGDRSDNYIETSGSLLIAYGIYKACNLDLLPESYRQYADEANQGLYRKIFSRDGGNIFVTGVSSGTGPGDYQNYVSKKIGTGSDYPYGDGVFLQEKSEIVRQIFFRTFSISGVARYFANHKKIPGVVVQLSGDMTNVLETNSFGEYSFNLLSEGGNYQIVPSKAPNSDVSPEDITSYDAALVAQAAIGLRSLNSFEQIAADVSFDGTITLYDASLIARYSVGLIGLADSHVGGWVFIPEKREFLNLEEDKIHQDFEGIVIGNVHGNWRESNLGKFDLADKHFMPASIQANCGETFEIPIKFLGDKKSISIDMHVSFDPTAVSFVGISNIKLPGSANLFHNVSDGILKISVFQAQPFEGIDDFFTLKFKPISPRKNSSICIRRYQINDDLILKGECSIEIKANDFLPNRYSLYQNYPNPFYQNVANEYSTKIQYNIPVQSKISLKIFNIRGELVRTLKDGIESEGHREIRWDGRDGKGNFVSSGVYFYQLEAKSFRQRKKLIMVR